MYGNKTISEVIKNIDDMTKYYSFSLKTDDSYIGLIVFIIYIVVLVIMISSTLILYIKKLKLQFHFLTNDFWIISMFGSIIYLSTILTLYGDITNIKCQLRMILISIGFIFNFIPILYILIIHFKDNTVSEWINKHRFRFLLTLILIMILLNSLLFIPSYNIKNIVVLDGQNFHKCIMTDAFGINILYFILSLYIINIIFIIFLIYMEWNNNEIHFYNKILIFLIIMDILILIIYFFFSYIEINNFIAYNLILLSNIYLFSISNYIFIFGIRLISPSTTNDDVELSECYSNERQSANTYYLISDANSTSSFSKSYDEIPN